MATIDPRSIAGTEQCFIRSATPGDASDMLRLRHRLSNETEFMSREPREITVTSDSQREHILGRTAAERDLLLVAVVAGQLVGILGFNSRPLVRLRHQGEFGIGVLQDFWGRGIGGALLSSLCDWADSVGIVRISLIVAADNVRAIKLYEHFGFVTEGRLRKDVKLSDGFHDSLLMARVTEVR